MGDREISVAVTPNGCALCLLHSTLCADRMLGCSRADAVTLGPDGKLYFVEPYTQKMTMTSFLDTLSSG